MIFLVAVVSLVIGVGIGLRLARYRDQRWEAKSVENFSAFRAAIKEYRPITRSDPPRHARIYDIREEGE